MSLRFTSQLNIDNLPDEQVEDQFEVIMPELTLNYNNENVNKESSFNLSQMVDKISSDITYRPIVEEIGFTPTCFELATRRVRTGWLVVPQDIAQYKKVIITMFCPASMLTQQYLEAWRALIYNKSGEYYYSVNNYKKNIEVLLYGPQVLGRRADPTFRFTLVGCFPEQQQAIQLRYSNDPHRFRIMATFSVDRVDFDEKTAKKAAIQEKITSPTSILDRFLSSHTTESPKYSTQATY